MKKITLFIMLLVVSAAAFSQQINASPALNKQDYLQKSKKQKTAAWILLGGGAALTGTGILVPAGEKTGIGLGLYGLYEKKENDGIKAALRLTGTIAMLVSIPFFISAGKNKKKAMSLSLKNEMVPVLYHTGIINQTLPSLHLKISL